ncbi:MAG: DUF2520 domain-containing protein [Pseudobdellovibrio sp.]
MTTQNEHSITILLIGSGRLAKHLLYWNSLLNNPNQILIWDRSQAPELLIQHLNQSKLVWLAISDSAIIPFFEKNLTACNQQVIHFSGVLHDSRMISAHPLMSFPTELLAAPIYNEIYFALTGTATLNLALPGFLNSFFTLSAEEKPLYHALCVVAGNFPQLLWLEVEKKFTDLQVPKKAFHIYLHQILNNYLLLKEKSLSGPIIRKDFLTLEKNQLALAGSKLKSIYQSFVREFTT